MKKPLTNPKAKAEMIAYVLGDGFLEAARLLRQTEEKSPHLFAEVAEQTGLSLRGAYVLVQIDLVFHELGVSRQRLEKIGWAKLQILGGVIDAENCERLLTLAETHSIYELQTILNDGRGPLLSEAVVLFMSPEQISTLESALLKHGATRVGGKLIGREAALIAALASS